MLYLRRLYSKIPKDKVLYEKLRKSYKNKKALKFLKDNMDKNNSVTYSKFRQWHNLCDNKIDNNDQINLLSYNILSQDLLNKHIYLYFGIDHSFLNWEYRLSKLREEILSLRPDILCLQEMQMNHLKKLIKAIDTGNNLEYIYKKKTGIRPDGCVIAYDRRKFKLLEEYTVEYYESPADPLNRENIAIIVKLCTKTGNCPKEFLVATTHLLYNPRREDVRLAQIHRLISELQNRSINTKDSQRLPILLTGDFNFVPFSCPHEYIAAGILKADDTSIKLPTDGKHVSHPLRLASAYDEYNASTYQDKWITVDYIFYSSKENLNYIKIWSTYGLPSKDICNEMGKIPNHTLGSDHLCLAIKFSIETSTA